LQKGLEISTLARKRDALEHSGFERIKWEANHTYKEMAAAIGRSEAAVYKVSRGERPLSDRWVSDIATAYSKILKRHVSEAEVRGESVRGYVDFNTLNENLPNEAGSVEEEEYQFITKLVNSDLDGLIPSGSYANLSQNTTMKDQCLYVIEVDGDLRSVRYKTGDQPCFDTIPKNMKRLESWSLSNTEYRVLYKIVSFLTVL
tara:strand:- start:1089 stop:1694 length:606 start_codon:yes stop_codon:yes gene_type:complete